MLRLYSRGALKTLTMFMLALGSRHTVRNSCCQALSFGICCMDTNDGVVCYATLHFVTNPIGGFLAWSVATIAAPKWTCVIDKMKIVMTLTGSNPWPWMAFQCRIAE